MTAIAIFLRPERIVFGSDSRVCSRDEDGGTWTGSAQKIRRAGRWNYLVGGYIAHPGATRDMFTIVDAAIRDATTIRAAMEAVYRDVSVMIVDAFAALHRRGQVPMLQVFVGGVEGGRLVVGHLEAKVTGHDPFRVSCGAGVSTEGYGDANGEISFTATVADDGPALTLMQAPRPAWVQRGDIEAARRLLALQCAATPDLVAAPIHILEITATGSRTLTDHGQEIDR